jgi:hypothetical protein
MVTSKMMFNQNVKRMLDYIHLSQTTPCNEPCAQVGEENYMTNARIEAHVYLDQLRRTFGENPQGSFFKVVRCPHDFGTYLDIRFYYDDEDQQHVRYMSDVESGCETWDAHALQQLQRANYRLEGIGHSQG